MLNILMVGLGGMLGAVGRYATGVLIHHVVLGPWFPYGTLAANMIGCFLIGLFAGWGEAHEIFSHRMRLFVFTGFLGGFTTFSSFGYDTIDLLGQGRPGAALFNVSIHLVLGLSAVWLGLIIGR